MDASAARLAHMHRSASPRLETSAYAKVEDVLDDASFPSLGTSQSPQDASMPSSMGVTSNIMMEVMDLPGAEGFRKQGKNFGEIARLAQAKSGASMIEVSTSKRGDLVTFLIKGKPETIVKARRAITDALAAKMTVSVLIPVAAVRLIVGAKGQMIASIRERTGADIQVPQQRSTQDADGEVEIKITGDAVACSQARAEIHRIIQDKLPQQKRNVRLADIPWRWWAFLQPVVDTLRQDGVISKATRVSIPPLQWTLPKLDEDILVREQDEPCVEAFGPKLEVDKAVEQLTAAVRRMKATYKTLVVQVPKRQHRYLLSNTGERQEALLEILKDTGCQVLVASSDKPRDDSILIRGPESSLLAALNRVMNVVNSVKHVRVDLTAIYRAAPYPEHHARRVFRYLVASKQLESLEKEHDVEFSLVGYDVGSAVPPPAGILLLELSGKSAQQLDAAANKLMIAASQLAPFHVDVVHVPGSSRGHIFGFKGEHAQQYGAPHGVYVLPPGAGSVLNTKTEPLGPLLGEKGDDVILVYHNHDGSGYHMAHLGVPAAAVSGRQLASTRADILRAANADAKHTTQVINVPEELRRYILQNGNIRPDILETQDRQHALHPIVALGGDPTHLPDAGGLNPADVLIRGHPEYVKSVEQRILEAIEKGKMDKERRSYTEAFDLPRKSLPRIIGRGGVGLQKLKEKHDVDISIDDNKSKSAVENETAKVTVKGYQENVAAARKLLTGLATSLVNQIEVKINVPSRLHSSLIGPQGRYVKRLEEKYNVRIKFPRSVNTVVVVDEDDNEGDLEEVGHGDAQNPDEISIRGEKKGVEATKAELLELAAYEEERNNVEVFDIPFNCLRHIIGKGGARISEIQEENDVRIDIDHPLADKVKESGESGRDAEKEKARISIRGTSQGVRKAKAAIMDIVQDQLSVVTEIIHIPQNLHRHLIGPGGQNIRDALTRAIGEYTPGFVSFPRAKSDAPSEDNDCVVLKGKKKQVQQVRQELERIVAELGQLQTVIVMVPVHDRASIIGRGGQTIRDLQDRWNVEVDVAKTPSDGAEFEVKIRGKSDACESAAQDIHNHIRAVAWIRVPRSLNEALAGAKGVNLRRLRSDFDVQVDYPKSKEDGTELVTLGSEDEDGMFWRLLGPKERVLAAVDWLRKRFEECQYFTHSEQLSVPIEHHKLVLGRGGSVINGIREKTGCRIELPRLKAGKPSNDMISISGTEQGVELAKTLILEATKVNAEKDEEPVAEMPSESQQDDVEHRGYAV